MEPDLDAIVALELRLLDPAVRADRAAAGALLHPEFREIGASGRVWDRETILDALAADPGGGSAPRGFEARAVGPDQVLLTYEVVAPRRSQRSSLWVRDEHGWRMRFHQGTPVPGAGLDRAVLVTGASRGIGAAVAHAFAATGDRVAVHYGSSRERAEAVAAGLPGSGHAVVGADLADADAVRRMVDAAAEALVGIDVLVNNAGVIRPHPIGETSYEAWQDAWREIVAVNLTGAANVTWCAVRHMGRGGRIVNIASRGAFRGEPRQPAYGATKAGLLALGQSLARSLGPRGIAVTGVAPGFTETEMAAEALAGEQGALRRAESPLGRVATPAEVAAAVVYLASPAAELASGSVIDVNGASHLRL
jgi:3-oxoacyl-[acyl-carrier protein] reductase